jgi:hypothetical protein
MTMHPILLTLAFISILNAGLICVTGSEFKIDLKIGGKPTGEVLLKIDGDMATAKVAEETEQFNLKDLSWLDPETSKWTTLAQCKDWAEQSKAKSLKSFSTAPADVRPLALWCLDPKFKVEKVQDTLRLTSGQVDYVIEGQASTNATENYFRYAMLNAYKKAMTDRKLPPFSELKAIDEMKNLGYIPRKLSVTIPASRRRPQPRS